MPTLILSLALLISVFSAVTNSLTCTDLTGTTDRLLSVYAILSPLAVCTATITIAVRLTCLTALAALTRIVLAGLAVCTITAVINVPGVALQRCYGIAYLVDMHRFDLDRCSRLYGCSVCEAGLSYATVSHFHRPRSAVRTPERC